MLRLLLLFLGLPFIALAQQEPVLLKACVIDGTGNVVPDANVTIAGDFFSGTATNSNGCFEISADDLPLTLQISHINFEMLSISVEYEKDLLEVVVLKELVQSLPGVTVRATVKIDTVYQEPYSVVDYFFYEEHLVLLACKNSLVGYSLILLDKEGQEIQDFSLRHLRPKNLHQSCDGKLYLMTSVSVKEIVLEEARIKFGQSIQREDFANGWATCVLANNSMAFFKRYFYQGQAVQYTSVFRRKKPLQVFKFPLIEDERNIDLLIEESGIRMPWSGNVWEENVSFRLVVLREGDYTLTGIEGIFFPPLYTPLYPKDSLVCIFNHLTSQIEYYSSLGEFLFPVKIDYHQQKKWKKKIYYDSFQEQAYTSYDTRMGVNVCSINMETGKLGMPTEIPMDFIENVKIWNGALYYLYRNIGKREWNRKLHRIQLK